MITKKLNKLFGRYRTRKYVMCDDSIHRKSRENRESLAMNKAPTLGAMLANQRPACWIFLVACSFINEDELSRVGDEISNIVHVGGAIFVFLFKSLDRDKLAREVKP